MATYNILKEGPVGSFSWDGVTTYDDAGGDVNAHLSILSATSGGCYAAQINTVDPLLQDQATQPDMGSTPPT